ncbi:bifunctional phosphopantothenoylcysteine decarboxylase/phosphopantothenate--cysteine ligase CoaBC [Pseudovibrio exalbescens]|uniref:bifunctional phosphopantothenoylcysteine decarboxylase/phosphopantothenate--cysteine ligase CoaBC n=1 Tax=Pseudovibrio exalbescens TaxID=197461 RepID=UPI000C9CE3D8|nr:bifunctional phosphopantothenoylcysteine decarboxylase/phosphopantothenate--cysteine ligase CoaBC [Pseudovibrio exalbescens]
MLSGKRILLIITGGIACYKSLDLIRRLQERGASVRAVMTEGAQQFITPLSVGALTGGKVFTDLFDREAEHDVGHIRLSREADLIVVAPATANIMAKMAGGHADDLASCVLLATDKPVLLAPAMNSRMWSHQATQRNLKVLKADGILTVGPNAGEMAEKGEAGYGRMSEPLEIADAIVAHFTPSEAPLKGKRIVITSGPTHEAIDPVRYIANRSSGRQGHAIAVAAAQAGADVTLVSGPVSIPDPKGVKVVRVESAREMQAAVEQSLPCDVAIMAAAVADWRVASDAAKKIKKDGSGKVPALQFVENPDILAGVGNHTRLRPRLVIGFAAETHDLIENAQGKLKRKGADWIVANDVSPENNVMGGTENTVRIVTADGVEDWPKMGKEAVAEQLVARIADRLSQD